MSNDHIVYTAFDSKGNCLYVGEGKPERYKHVTSGVSHVYEANKWHFSGKPISVSVIYSGLTKRKALELEKLEISKLKPAWNKCEHGTVQLMQMCNFVSKTIRSFVKVNTRYAGKKDFYITLAKDICKLLNQEGETTILQGQKWNSVKIPNGFMSHLANGEDKYYPALKTIFFVERLSESNSYRIKLKGWLQE